MYEIRNAILIPNRRIKSGNVVQVHAFMEMYSICENFHVMPKAGGLLDQDSLFVYLLKFAMICHHERQELDARRNR